MLEDLNIPSLDDKFEEKEEPIINDPSNLDIIEAHWDNALRCSEIPKGCVRNNEDTTATITTTTVRNISPQLGEVEEWNTPEQSNSEDSSLSDSDKTLVGDAPEDNDPQTPSQWLSHRSFKISKQFEIENWDIDDDSDYYFKATPCTESNQKRMCPLKI